MGEHLQPRHERGRPQRHAVSLLPHLLLVASRESACQHATGISPRCLFAAIFDIAFGADVEAERALQLDHAARAVISGVPVGGGLSAYLAALIASETKVGELLRSVGTSVAETEFEPMSDRDLAATRAALAPRLTSPLSHSGTVTVRDTSLVPSAATSFEAAACELADAGIELTILFGWRSHDEQRAYHDAISAIVKNRNSFPVAPPGQSLHERGLALDLAYDGYTGDFRASEPSATARVIRQTLRDHGWYQVNPYDDAVHFTFGRIG
jgi:hypothetical protein